MAIIYRSDNWLDTQAKTLERRILNRHGSSPTFTAIARMLLHGIDIAGTRNALREIQDGNTLVLDEEEYKAHKRDIINHFLNT